MPCSARRLALVLFHTFKFTLDAFDGFRSIMRFRVIAFFVRQASYRCAVSSICSVAKFCEQQ
jgi:hypothetical protein